MVELRGELIASGLLRPLKRSENGTGVQTGSPNYTI